MSLENVNRWEPVDAPLQNRPGARSPAKLCAVVKQFGVTTNPRYLRAGGLTFCNIFAWDVTRALHAEIPHWVKDSTRKKGRREQTANMMLDWLEIAGGGWRELLKGDAALRASEGFPTVVLWRNPTGKPGHIAILLPSVDGQPRIAQAGRRNGFDVPLSAFGAVKPLRFFTHD